MKANVEPRAKIGDVVIVKNEFGINQCSVDAAQFGSLWTYYESQNFMHNNDIIIFYDKDILKNLTTNVSYEN